MSRAPLLTAVISHGGLLPLDFLARIQSGASDLPALDPESFHLLPHERLGDAVNRAWTRLLPAWRAFRGALENEPETSAATRLTRERWILPLFHELGYGHLERAATITVDQRPFAISHLSHRSPIHILGARIDLDRRQKGVAGAAKASPHGLIQDFLNRSDDHLWGFLSNGLRLRVLRDHFSLTRQAYIEFDLEAIMDGELFGEFFLVWLLCHQSRITAGPDSDKPQDCILETWLKTSRDQGIRALDKLRSGVEQAIAALGTGFLAHPDNYPLKQALGDGKLDKQDYYRQLLRLVYRLIFLFVAEERGALLDPEANDAARDRYQRFYATRRIRELADRRRGGPHSDLWIQLRLLMRKLDTGCPQLALPALGSFLWHPESCAALDDALCSNEYLLNAIRHLTYIHDRATRYPVDWRNVGAEELGSIYESLLELHPRIERDAATFALDTATGHERKTTGSYYTPSSLVDCLLDSALDPVLDEAARRPDPEAAILALNVCDPACGSGHFLLAAARRIAKRLAAVRSGDDEPSPPEIQRALRDVAGHCLYGVDINPMAVELCKVSLWMEAIDPGRPLSFLESHIQCGNALLGATPALMARGIPDEAFKPIEGDDKETAKALKKRNKRERKDVAAGQATMFDTFEGVPADLDTVAGRVAELEAMADTDIANVRGKEQSWSALQRSPEYVDARFRANAWCAAFVWPKKQGELGEAAITHERWQRMQQDVTSVSALTRQTVQKLAREYQFFHWYLAFPYVFGWSQERFNGEDTTGWTGGFDVVIGNPPWDSVQFNETEFFAVVRPEIAAAPTASKRKHLIAGLKTEDPPLFRAYERSLRMVGGQNVFVRAGMTYPLCGVGRVNLFALFAERARSVVSSRGAIGQILPSGIVTDDSTKRFFQVILSSRELVHFFDFENREGIFPVHRSFKFGLLALNRSPLNPTAAEFVFFATKVLHVNEPERRFTLSGEDIALLNPDTKTCPVFRSRRDAELTKGVYHRLPVLKRSAWRISHKRLINKSDDSQNFLSEARCGYLPLYEGKYFHHYDHRWVTNDQDSDRSLTDSERNTPSYFVQPRYWYPVDDLVSRFKTSLHHPWVLAWRDIARSTDERTLIAAVLPSIAVPHTARVILIEEPHLRLLPAFVANLAAFALDFAARQKIGGTHMSGFIVDQLPVVPPDTFSLTCQWDLQTILSDWLLPRVLELTYTAWDLEPFAYDMGYADSPFHWNPERRFLLRAELDAAFFHLYGIGRDDVDYIMETFPIVRKNDEKAHGTYRTKGKILDIYDRMQRAIDIGEPYQTLLEPPPADPSCAHHESTRPNWAQGHG